MARSKSLELVLKARSTAQAAMERARAGVASFASRSAAQLKTVYAAAMQVKNAVALMVAGMAVRAVFRPTMEIQDIELSLRRMEGGADAAKSKVQELLNLSANTPFQMKGFAQAYKQLRNLTDGALGSERHLRMVGDAVAELGEEVVSMPELATWVGRLYSSLQSGRPIGEAMMRMQELGIVSGDMRNRIEALAATTNGGTEAWALFEQTLGRFAGSMDERSQGLSGSISTLRDVWDQLMASVGNSVLPEVVAQLRDVTEAVKALDAITKSMTGGDGLGEVFRGMMAPVRLVTSQIRNVRDFLDPHAASRGAGAATPAAVAGGMPAAPTAPGRKNQNEEEWARLAAISIRQRREEEAAARAAAERQAAFEAGLAEEKAKQETASAERVARIQAAIDEEQGRKRQMLWDRRLDAMEASWQERIGQLRVEIEVADGQIDAALAKIDALRQRVFQPGGKAAQDAQDKDAKRQQVREARINKRMGQRFNQLVHDKGGRWREFATDELKDWVDLQQAKGQRRRAERNKARAEMGIEELEGQIGKLRGKRLSRRQRQELAEMEARLKELNAAKAEAAKNRPLTQADALKIAKETFQEPIKEVIKKLGLHWAGGQ